jgi:hypothetical protein
LINISTQFTFYTNESQKTLNNSTKVFERLHEVLGVKKLDEAAVILGMNPATFRGRKSRGAVPFEELIRSLNTEDLLYVLKGERINQMNPGFPDSKGKIEDGFERFSVELIERIEVAPFSRQAKLRIIGALLRIVEQDLSEKSLLLITADPQ